MVFRKRNREGEPLLDGALGDPNEEEQKKWPHEAPPEISDPSEPAVHPYPMECPPPSLPDTGGERSIVVREEGWPRAASTRVPRRRSARFGGYLVMAASLLVAFLLMIGALCLSAPSETNASASPDGVSSAEKVITVNRYGEDGLSTPALYDRCIDSVVSVSVGNGASNGIGSGFVLSEDGYVATAHHVVSGMTHISVVLSDERRYEARLVASDALTDLALLKIEATGLSPVTRGSSDSLCAGERVVAIGTPASLDYAGSVCSGEVSYALRTVKFYGEDGRTLKKKMKLIQTNAPVNPGNSGCPLFDGRGAVVGMVTMKLGHAFAGMGFAIPADGAFAILDAMRVGEPLGESLLASVGVRAATLGITGAAETVGSVYGVRVTGFSPSGRADEVLAVGDLITAISDRAVARLSDIEDAILPYEPGDRVAVSVLRNGQLLQFDVVLAAVENSAEK